MLRKGADCIFMKLFGLIHGGPFWGLANGSFSSVWPNLVLAASLRCAGTAAMSGAVHGEAVRGES